MRNKEQWKNKITQKGNHHEWKEWELRYLTQSGFPILNCKAKKDRGRKKEIEGGNERCVVRMLSPFLSLLCFFSPRHKHVITTRDDQNFFFFSPLSVAVMHVASLININNNINKCEPTMRNSSPTRVSLGEKEGENVCWGWKVQSASWMWRREGKVETIRDVQLGGVK